MIAPKPTGEVLHYKKGTKLYELIHGEKGLIFKETNLYLEEDTELPVWTNVTDCQAAIKNEETNTWLYVKTADAIENSKKSIIDFFYKEETPTHVEVDEEGNETLVEDEPVKNLDWFKIGATSGGFLAVIAAIIWFFFKHKHN